MQRGEHGEYFDENGDVIEGEQLEEILRGTREESEERERRHRTEDLQREQVMSRATFHAPLTGFYVISKSYVPKGISFHNIDSGELALHVKLEDANEGNHILVDSAAAKLVIHLRKHGGDTFDVWSIVEQRFLHSIPVSAPKVALINADGTKLFFDQNSEARKRIFVADTDAGVVLWSTAVEFNNEYLYMMHSMTACFTTNNDHLVALFTDCVKGEQNKYLDRVTLRFHSASTGNVDQTTVVLPFSGDTVQPGICDLAVLVSGAQFKQLGVVLVGADLTSNRIVLIPTTILPMQLNLGSRFIRFGPSNTLIVSLNNESAATVVSYDCSLEETSRAPGDVRKVCDVTLPKPFNFYDHFSVHSSSNRLAIAFAPDQGYNHSTQRNIHCYDIASGALLGVFESADAVALVGAVENGMVVLL
jgi:hypothetical protein